MAPELTIGPTARIARHFAMDLRQAIAAAPPEHLFTLAVPGGSVARAFFPALAAADVDWRRLAVLFVDERAVPPDDVESNFALAMSLWLAPARVPEERVHRMRAERIPIADAAAEYAARLRELAGTPPRLDYVLLGVGEDGHVASLFPGDPALDVPPETTVAWTTRAPKPPSTRLTLALPTIARAARVVIAAFGAGKAPVIDRALHDAGEDTPLARVLRTASDPLLLLDDAAAASAA